MSIFDDLNRKITDMAVGSDETIISTPISRPLDPFQNADSIPADAPHEMPEPSIPANQPPKTPLSAAGEGIDFKRESVAPAEAIRSHVANPSAVMKRYKDAYTVANIANGFGKLAKTLGIIVAALIIFGGLIFAAYAAGSSSGSTPYNPYGMNTAPGAGAGLMIFFVFGFWGVFWGAIFYLIGVFLSALGQNLMASLDTAVYNSPFLTDEQKAYAMGVQITSTERFFPK